MAAQQISLRYFKALANFLAAFAIFLAALANVSNTLDA